jgi:hypothetical protein
MTRWTWKTVDYSKAKVGDTIENEGYSEVSYIKEIRVRNKNVGITRQEVISPEYGVTLMGYSHRFHWVSQPGAGYGFDCYEDGSIPNADRIVDWGDGTNQTFGEYFEEVKAKEGLIYDGIETFENSFNIPAVIRCACGGEVALEMVMTNTCEKCKRDYNSSGQLLAPRSQWGWDTGETADEILSSDWSINDDTYDSVYEDRF